MGTILSCNKQLDIEQHGSLNYDTYYPMISSAFKRLTALVLSALLLCTSLHAQQRVTLSGTVVDALGPVISAGVVQLGTTNGTVTDMDGHFSITVPAGSTVEISALGYLPQQLVVNQTKTVTIQLEEDNLQLEETSWSLCPHPSIAGSRRPPGRRG